MTAQYAGRQTNISCFYSMSQNSNLAVYYIFLIFQMFDHCLAPSTIGDGTGCDNMTAILVRFKDGLVADVAQHTASTETTKKRAADDEDMEDKQESKRQKVDDSLSSSIVTSSV